LNMVTGGGPASQDRAAMNRHVTLAAKVALTAVLLGFLAYKADWHAVGGLLAGASPAWLVLGALLGIPASVFSGLRWRQISAYLGVPLPWRFAVLGAMESIAFNLLLPGSIGGDVLRVVKVTRARGKLHRNFAGVVFDRAVNVGVLLALLLDQPMWGQGIVRILVIAPFFVMPTVSALVWKNMFMDPVNGVLSHLFEFFGAQPVDWLAHAPMTSIIMIVSWQWLPFATLILLTAVQSLDGEQLEAAEMDGAPLLKRFAYIILPHLARAITVVILIQTIFLLSIFAEIFVTTQGSFGTRTLTYLIYQRVLESQNVGLGSAGGIYAVILANIVAIFLMRIVGKNLDA